uniref:DUF6603 domain-containing protein n=1 Tax=Streptomyces sp. NBC_00093 TaxID=2975649 RepID=A0AAU2AII0_9ACTN
MAAQDPPTTEHQLALWLGLALAPLTEVAVDPARRAKLLADLGFTPPAEIPDLGLDAAHLTALDTATDDLFAAIAAGDASADEYAAVLLAVVNMVGDVLAMGDRLTAVLDAAYLQVSRIAELLPERLLHWMLVEQLRHNAPLLGLLTALGLVDDGEPGGASYPRLRLDRLGLLMNPGALLADVYGWGTADPNLELALDRLVLMLRMVWSPATFGISVEAALAAATDDSTVPRAVDADDYGRPDEARLPVVAREVYGVDLDAGVTLRLVDADGVRRAALALSPILDGDATVTVPLGSGAWLLAVGVKGEVSFDAVTIAPGPGGQGVTVTPPGGVVAGGRVTLGLTRQNADGTPVRLFTVAGVAVLEARSVGVAFAAGASTTGGLDLGVELTLVGGVVRFGTGAADGFMAKALPPGGIEATLDLTLGWATERGFYVRGGAGLEISIPVHTTYLSVLTIDTVDLAVALRETGTLDAAVAATFRVELGPAKAAVEKMGVSARLEFPPGGGNLGPAQLGMAFRPPDGASLSLNAKPVSGGGYVRNDPDKGRYGGILQLRIADTVAVTAIGLIATKLPDGRRGFSLLVIITAQFPPIQLGLGFTLNGLGGLFGAHRSMDLAALRAGVRNRGIDSVLFPIDPVGNSLRVVRDVEAFFPVTEGQFCVGLMAAIGWGTPTLVKAEIGVVVELPSPVRIALLGRLSVVLPDEDAAVVSLKVVVLGTIDFAAQELAIDASIYDSRIAVFGISGDFALRLNYGATPAFAVAIGGFNPRFAPPPGFPELARVQISLTTSDNPRLRLEAYLANTPTTVQAGARLDLYAEADLGILGMFSASAWLYFDALVYLLPKLTFIVDLGGGIAIARNGKPFLSAQLVLTLEGPQPVHGYGYAEIDFFGKHRLPIDVTVGPEPSPLVLPPGDPITALLTALGSAGNWSAQLPSAGGAGLVQLRDLGDVAEDLLLVHPFGAIAFSQRVAPLDVPIDTFEGAPPPPDAAVLSPRVSIGGLAATGSQVREAFPAGQFFTLSDDEKLTGEAFPRFCSGLAGLTVPERAVTPPPAVAGGEGYETAVLNPESWWPEPHDEPYAFANATLDVLVGTSAAGRAPTRTTGAAGFTGEPLGIAVVEKSYRLASTADLAPAAGSWATATEADLARGGDTGLQVVGAHEVGV